MDIEALRKSFGRCAWVSLFVAVSAVVALGCGSSESNGNGGGSGGTPSCSAEGSPSTGAFTGVVSCGASECTVGDEQCCLGDASSRCAASSETCDEGEIALGCDDPSDCSGTEVCCAELVFDFPQSARCVDRLSCPSEALDTEEIMLCTPAAADPCLGCGACQLAAAPLDDYSRCR